ncbi:MAG: presqualene diphosphate synthase HpnD [Bdellovibrionales bacterium]
MSTLTLNEAMKEVRQIVAASKTSFAAGMAVLPLPRREAMYALYAFCRVVDDIADDSPTEKERNEGLHLWRQRIHDLFQKNTPTDSITTALQQPIHSYALKEKDFLAIIDGMEMDAEQTIVAPSMDELDDYCDHVASAVGRISVRIFGDSSEYGQKVAHHMGRALQLTNILRDLAEDASRGRLYLPRDLLERYNIEERHPMDVLRHPNLPLLCQDLASIAEQHFAETDLALQRCIHHSMRPARQMRNYYHAILRKLKKANWQTPEARVSLSFFDKLLVFLRGMVD